MTDRYCAACGRPADDCDGTCRRPLDPPRFCVRCGRRVVVQVMPNHHVARCRHHGVVSADG